MVQCSVKAGLCWLGEHDTAGIASRHHYLPHFFPDCSSAYFSGLGKLCLRLSQLPLYTLQLTVRPIFSIAPPT